jgi:hypothetical protein
VIELRQHTRRWLGENVHIVYLDDSKQEETKQRFQLIGAVIVNDAVFNKLEQHLAYYLYELVEPDVGEKIEEFHSSDILAGRKPFEKVTRERAMQILSTAIAAVDEFHIPVIYGAVDLAKLCATDYATASPVDMAFRRCVRLVEEWFQEISPEDLGLLICDDGDKSVKSAMQKAFHLFRKRDIGSPPVRGILEHLHDDMYFGDSKYSRGIQLADICTFLIGRHLAGYSDTEDLYQQLSANIVKYSCEPS